MIDWLPCSLGLGYAVAAAGLGYIAGRFREQLHLLEIFKPER